MLLLYPLAAVQLYHQVTYGTLPYSEGDSAELGAANEATEEMHGATSMNEFKDPRQFKTTVGNTMV